MLLYCILNYRFCCSLKHGDLCITESNSISYILGKEVLWGKNAKENALIYQWIEYADTKLNPLVSKVILSSEVNRQSKKVSFFMISFFQMCFIHYFTKVLTTYCHHLTKPCNYFLHKNCF